MIRADGFDPTDDESYQRWRRMNEAIKIDDRSTKREEFASEVSNSCSPRSACSISRGTSFSLFAVWI